MTEHAVVIVGGGPTGLMLAGELALAGVDVAVVERHPNQDLTGSRRGGLLRMAGFVRSLSSQTRSALSHCQLVDADSKRKKHELEAVVD